MQVYESLVRTMTTSAGSSTGNNVNLRQRQRGPYGCWSIDRKTQRRDTAGDRSAAQYNQRVVPLACGASCSMHTVCPVCDKADTRYSTAAAAGQTYTAHVARQNQQR